MNQNINMHNMQQQMNAAGVSGHSPMMQPGMSPVMMQQASPQQPTNHPMGGPPSQMSQQTANPVQPQSQGQAQQTPPQQNVAAAQGAQQQQQQQQQQPPQQQQSEKMDNISKVKSLMGPLRESLFLTQRDAAFALQHNNLADNLKRDTPPHAGRFDKDLENFYAYCDEMELHIKTAIMCQQQQHSAQYYLPGVVTAGRSDNYMQDNPNGPIPYPVYLNIVRGQLQSAKDIHDTLMSAAQNISQAD